MTLIHHAKITCGRGASCRTGYKSNTKSTQRQTNTTQKGRQYMKNTYLFDTGSKTPEWRKPSSLDKASSLRDLRNIALHNKSSYSVAKLQEVFKSWEN